MASGGLLDVFISPRRRRGGPQGRPAGAADRVRRGARAPGPAPPAAAHGRAQRASPRRGRIFARGDRRAGRETRHRRGGLTATPRDRRRAMSDALGDPNNSRVRRPRPEPVEGRPHPLAVVRQAHHWVGVRGQAASRHTRGDRCDPNLRASRRASCCSSCCRWPLSSSARSGSRCASSIRRRRAPSSSPPPPPAAPTTAMPSATRRPSSATASTSRCASPADRSPTSRRSRTPPPACTRASSRAASPPARTRPDCCRSAASPTSRCGCSIPAATGSSA